MLLSEQLLTENILSDMKNAFIKLKQKGISWLRNTLAKAVAKKLAQMNKENPDKVKADFEKTIAAISKKIAI